MSKKRKSGKADRNNFIRGSALTAVLVALVVAIIGSVWWFFAYTKDDGLIYPNVYAFGVDLSGKTVEEAAAAIQDATASTFSTQSMTVQLPDCTLSLTPEQTGAAVDAQIIGNLSIPGNRPLLCRVGHRNHMMGYAIHFFFRRRNIAKYYVQNMHVNLGNLKVGHIFNTLFNRLLNAICKFGYVVTVFYHN
jgi:hypothetical protein